MMVVA